MNGVVFMKQVVAGDGINVKHNTHQEHDMAHAGNRSNECCDNESKLGNGRYEADHSEKSRQSGDHGKFARGRYEGKHDHGKIEHIPSIAKIPPHGGKDACNFKKCLENKTSEDEVACPFQNVSILLGNARGGFQAQDDAVQQDERDDGRFEYFGVDDPLCQL